MLKQLREQVLEANLEVVRRGLVLYTFGNVSGISREDNLVVIKPSGVPYERMKADDLVITDLEGKVVWGELRPSSDLDTHIHLYKAFPEIGGVVHTHSEHAVAWAQAGRPIPALGTTHADYFYGPVPVTRELTADEIKNDYVRATGVAIAEAFGNRDPMEVPAALVAGHGPFAWGRTPDDAVHNAVVLEAVARMAMYTFSLQPNAQGVSQALLDRHYFRKHGAAATYGQSEK
ncbi:L-ribulose-5-phosphate 4-epimerase [Microvirga lotononidis]|uniref:L-ribulose-5-phosphate 4-epimerase n=1 Tax=Microvirga lotononidis TaxID=864069 RepID=I4YL61_9HYPH|nr:L-ribulose-5-phosphate 4-epimerase [Microvirga lotononidis]EIM24703.1 ribulose-5-phosphate 4-epimerase-like epimerase or aldolase [Microvirga lotononidis]WQO26712.1 L-ribulose-5-phosphate 4-epimerase [Microvirga lotononidis]